MPSSKKRPTAMDDFQSHDPVFGTRGTFVEAYPEISDFSILATETTLGSSQIFAEHSYSLQDIPPQYVDCHHLRCRKGGFNVGAFLHDMVRNRETNKEKYITCKGHENMGRNQTRRCLNLLKVQATIVYK